LKRSQDRVDPDSFQLVQYDLPVRSLKKSSLYLTIKARINDLERIFRNRFQVGHSPGSDTKFSHVTLLTVVKQKSIAGRRWLDFTLDDG
jgi:hypothetical protein